MINYGLCGKVALITGANNPWGIGATTALAFAREGAKVVLVYKKIEREFDAAKADKHGVDRYFAANAGDAAAVEAKLSKMGADIKVDGNHAVIRGGAELSGAPLYCHDLRAGAAMVIAALATNGFSTLEGIDKIERGYYNIVGKLRELGADIQKKVNNPDEQRYTATY